MNPTRLRAQLVEPGLGYRLDYIAQPLASKFVWPMTVLSNVHPTPAKIGVVGWYLTDGEEVLLPTAPCPSIEQGRSDTLELVVLGSRGVKSARLEVLDQLKRIPETVEHNRFFPAGTGIAFQFRAAVAPELGRVRVKVEWESGGYKVLERAAELR